MYQYNSRRSGFRMGSGTRTRFILSSQKCLNWVQDIALNGWIWEAGKCRVNLHTSINQEGNVTEVRYERIRAKTDINETYTYVANIVGILPAS